MSSHAQQGQHADERPGAEREGPAPELTGRLGYLLKHAQQRLAELTAAALAPYGLTGRELAVMVVLAGGEPASQQQAARRLGVDRTTMVALLDALESKGLVARHPHADDRRRNIVELTAAGHVTLRDATRAGDEAERRFLAPLDQPAAKGLKDALRAVILPDA
ncbi:MAG: MarR family winged helix-turn-helix transcriptional regulator [Micromonosporaceae bacterium]